MSDRPPRMATAAELRVAVGHLEEAELHFRDLGVARLRGLVDHDQARQAHQRLLEARKNVRALAAPNAIPNHEEIR